MKIIGITGGVGAGKSVVLDYLAQRYQAYTVQADKVGHELMEPGAGCFFPILDLLGREILDDAGRIDRGKVAALAFPHPEVLAKLNGIVHPAVKKEIRRRIAIQREQGRKIFVIEAALLLEDHYDEICHDMWYIYADEQARQARLEMQRGYSREKIRDIFKNQQTEDAFRQKCDYTVENDKDLQETYRQIDKRIKTYEFM